MTRWMKDMKKMKKKRKAKKKIELTGALIFKVTLPIDCVTELLNYETNGLRLILEGKKIIPKRRDKISFLFGKTSLETKVKMKSEFRPS